MSYPAYTHHHSQGQTDTQQQHNQTTKQQPQTYTTQGLRQGYKKGLEGTRSTHNSTYTA